MHDSDMHASIFTQHFLILYIFLFYTNSKGVATFVQIHLHWGGLVSQVIYCYYTTANIVIIQLLKSLSVFVKFELYNLYIRKCCKKKKRKIIILN